MNEICRKMWDRDTTIKKWSEDHGFNCRYVQALTSGVRGKWNCGKGKKIMEALREEGFLCDGKTAVVEQSEEPANQG